MHKQEIEIAVQPDGSVHYTIKGIQGSSCESISQLLEQLGRVEEERRTGEYYAQSSDGVVHISQG